MEIVRPFAMPEVQRRVLYGGTIMKIDPATFAYLGSGYARDATRLWFHGEDVDGLDPATTHAFAGDYASDGTHVVYRQHPVNAHAPTFEVLGMLGRFAIARDRDRLYSLSDPIDGPDAGTFELLGAGLAADRSGLWQVGEIGECTRIEGDRATLQILDDDYARDRDCAWYRGTKLGEVDASFAALGHGVATDGTRMFIRGQPVPRPAQLVVLDDHWRIVDGRVRCWSDVETADPTSFQALGHLFAKDVKRVYFDGSAVDDADPDTFAVLAMTEGRGWVRDRERIWYRELQFHDYCDNESLTQIEGVDPETFVAIDDAFGRDAEHVWRGVALVDGADPASFRALGDGWYRDARELWRGDRRMTGADPDTLAIHGEYALLDLAEPDIEVLGDGFARSGDGVLFAGFTIDGPRAGARSLGGGYLVDREGAWFFELGTESRKVVEFIAMGGRLDGADPATLRRDRTFAIDRAHVFSRAQRLADADPATFRALDSHHGTDGRIAYFDAIPIDCDVARLRPLGGTFSPRGYTVTTMDDDDDAWATDGTTLFVYGRPVWDRTARYLSTESEELLRRLDVPAFAILDPWWGTDGHVVVDLRDGGVEAAAHAPSFETLGHGYARDISHVWSRAGRLADANPATFRVLADGYAVQGDKAWFRGYPSPDRGAIKGELRVLGGGWARDDEGILCGYKRVDADPATFVVVGAATAAESDWDPSRLAIDDPLWLGERVAVGRDRDRLWWGSYSGQTPATAVAIGHGYAVDDTDVWHAGTALDADGATFVAIGGGYARDAFRAYFHERVTR